MAFRSRNRGLFRAGSGPRTSNANYDSAVAGLGGLMWYGNPARFDSVTWPTLSEAVSSDLASTKGTNWFSSWAAESGYMPTNYNSAAQSTITGILWFSEADQLDP